jgi:hypothetical protein
MDQKRINRNDKFCSAVRKKDVCCVLSNNDSIQCECAHIVPLNGDFGQANFKNPELLNDPANGMLLSKDLHFLYDMFVWTINPENFTIIPGIPVKHEYKIDIVSSYQGKKISINNYKTITLRSECHEFVKVAYEIFKYNWNPKDSKKLEIKPTSKFNFTDTNVSISYISIGKLSIENKESFEDELLEIIQQGKNLTKKKKEELSVKYNIHPESIAPHFGNLKKTSKSKKR